MIFLFLIMAPAMSGAFKVDRLPGTSNETWKSEVTFDDTLRIIKGQQISIREVPYSIAILRGRSELLCSGGLIHENWVLTAAHCLPLHMFRKSQLYVGGGLDNVFAAGPYYTRKVTQIAIHPKYIPYTSAGYDLGIAHFDKPFPPSEYIQIISLSSEPWPLSRKTGFKCIAAGFGKTDTGAKTTGLRKSYVNMVHDNFGCPCLSREKNSIAICSANRGVTCHGDSGSLLNCHGKAWGISSGLYSPDACERLASSLEPITCSNQISLYMYICPFLEWIGKYVPNTPKMPSSCRERPRRYFSGLYGTGGDKWNLATTNLGDALLTISIQLFFIKSYQ